MLYAINRFEEKVTAKPKQKAICPNCNSTLISKCGEINIWHWAHENKEECDSWSEGESQWHLSWKEFVKPQFCEYKIGKHRADIIHPCWIIELQKSYLNPIEIQKREMFYGKMIWLWCGIDSYKNFTLWATKPIFNYNKGKPYQTNKNNITFEWKWAKRTFEIITKKTFIDFGEEIMLIKKIDFSDSPVTGSGYILTKQDFMRIYMKPILKEEYKHDTITT